MLKVGCSIMKINKHAVSLTACLFRYGFSHVKISVGSWSNFDFIGGTLATYHKKLFTRSQTTDNDAKTTRQVSHYFSYDNEDNSFPVLFVNYPFKNNNFGTRRLHRVHQAE